MFAIRKPLETFTQYDRWYVCNCCFGIEIVKTETPKCSTPVAVLQTLLLMVFHIWWNNKLCVTKLSISFCFVIVHLHFCPFKMFSSISKVLPVTYFSSIPFIFTHTRMFSWTAYSFYPQHAPKFIRRWIPTFSNPVFGKVLPLADFTWQRIQRMTQRTFNSSVVFAFLHACQRIIWLAKCLTDSSVSRIRENWISS